MVRQKDIKKWNRMPLAVFAMGVLSITILIWFGRLSQSLNESFDFYDILLNIHVRTASSHLWLEEAISEGSSANMQTAFKEMDLAIGLCERVLNGGISEHGTQLEPLKDLNLHARVEDIYTSLLQLRTLALQRAENPSVAGLGSLQDASFDMIFEETQDKSQALEALLEKNLLQDRASSKDLFWMVLIVWTCIVVGATAALWGLEVRRKAAEKNLRIANMKLQSRAEELKKHQEQLSELVAEKTAELTASNQSLQMEIVERKLMEASLRASESKFRTLVENLPQEIYLKNKNSVYVYGNDNFARSLSLRPDQITAKTDYDLFPDMLAEKEIAEDKEILQSGKTCEIEERRSRNGQEIVLQKLKVPIRNEGAGAAGVLGIVWDITEKVRLESIAEAANTMQNIGYVFSGIRHEIGNPINTIKMSLSILAKMIDTGPRENIKKYLEWTNSEIARVEYLLKTLKNFNMYETPELENVHMNTFMDRFLALVSGDFKKKGIRIGSRMGPDVTYGYVDPRALQQVMLNIVNNAADALEGKENPQIRIEALKSDGFITIRATDNGRGMSEDQQKDLFKPFRTTKAQGTGLGLVIAKKMLAGMKGTIEIKSWKDQGTTVSISIPEGMHGFSQEYKDTACH